MRSNPRVDLHCHSTFSDGALEPEVLVDRLAAATVAFAALTDHDSVDGLDRFRAAAARRGIATITGAELTSHYGGLEAHVLAYGFIPDDPFKNAILSVRQRRLKAMNRREPLHSIEEVLLNIANDSSPTLTVESYAPPTLQVIDLIHQSGGKAFLAHPLYLEKDRQKLREILIDLKKAGLDGVEAVYGAFSPEDRRWLCDVASELNLLVSAGVDQHSAKPDSPFGIVMPSQLWKNFRQAVASGAAAIDPSAPPPRGEMRLRQFAVHIILPTVLAVALFVGAIFGVFLPTLENSLMDRKREMIRELTNSALSVLTEAHQQETLGKLSRDQAMELAKTRVGALRYGREGKDYFWIQDLHPNMVMHPYRQDLDGKDLTDFRDPRGNAIFVQFADLVRRKNEGYVEYVWQWKDDPTHLAPKESYIRGFTPWGWVIGTGLYLDDVHEEISRIERGLALASAGISVLVVLLLAYVMRESLRLERKRSAAEHDLHESRERYRCLIEAASEGALLMLQDRCRYANPVLLDMLGLTHRELELMDLHDLLGARDENPAAWDAIEQATSNSKAADAIPARLKKRDGSFLSCSISIRPLGSPGRIGLILLARPDSGVSRAPQNQALIDRLLQLPSDVASDLAAQVSISHDPSEIASLCKQTPRLVRSLIDCGAHPRHMTRLVASVCDAATARLVQLAQESIGPSPAPFAFIALGSQGRKEQTLCTDQDNAILYADNAPASADAYFEELGKQVCKGLADCGYLLCSGNIMASNPKWRMPLESWRRCFSQWIAKSEPKELLEFSIFFDFRAVFGDESLVSQLRSHVKSASASAPDFLPRFAQNSILFKPPRWIFGRLVGAETPGMLDLKAAMMPIVSFSRLYSLKHGLAETGTLDRLATLATLGLIPESTRSDIQEAYESLMRLRLGHQAQSLQAGQPADNLIAPSRLGHIELAVLKESFAEIEACQQRITYDFLGGTTV